GPRAAGDLVEELVHPVGEDLHLGLLQGDAHGAGGVVGLLEVEGAVAWLAHGAGDEPARTVEEMDLTGHAPRLRGRPGRSPRRHRTGAAADTQGTAVSDGGPRAAADDRVGGGRAPAPPAGRRDERGD